MTSRSLVLRLALIAIGSVLSFVLVAGAYSLLTGRALLPALAGLDTSYTPRTQMADVDRVAAGALTTGSFAQDIDPRVAFHIKGNSKRTFLRAEMETDQWGMPRRVGPAPAPDAPRVVVLGDSVAFGFGLTNEDTIGAQLEELLARTVAPGTPRPVVETVACPGWNFPNIERYLKNHLDRLDPEVVVYVPSGNDLHDSYDVNESGYRLSYFDPAYGLAEPHRTLDSYAWFVAHFAPRLPARVLAKAVGDRAGVGLGHALTSDVTRHSQRRWSGLAASLADVHARMAQRGGHLFVALIYADPFNRVLEHRLHAHPEVRQVLLFPEANYTPDTLGYDPHPNAEFAGAIAWRLAEALVAAGVVEGAAAERLPPESAAFRDRRRAPDPAAAAVWHRETTDVCRSFLEPEVDFENGVGCHQVYGGLWVDGMLGTIAGLALANPGAARLHLRVARPERESSLYPFSLRVAIDDVELPPLRVARPAPGDDLETTLTVDVPAELRDRPSLDVTLAVTESRVRLWEMPEQLGEHARLECVTIRRVHLE